MTNITTVPKLLRKSVEAWPSVAAQYSKDKGGKFQPTTYSELMQNIYDVAAGFLSIGVNRGDLIGLFSDNRKEWLEVSFAAMSIGAGDVPRGSDATIQDLTYILSLTECEIAVVENETQVKKVLGLKGETLNLKHIISFDTLSDEALESVTKKGIRFTYFADLKQTGKEFRIANPAKVEQELDKGTGEEIACVIFTSGTTGEPKGVILTHSNFLAQFSDLQERIYLNPGDKALSVLPVWHSFERSCEYVILLQGAAVCYSKPVGSIMLGDLQTLNPQILPAVPRVFEAVYEGVQRAMRKTGGVVYKLFKFFTKVGIIHAKMDRKLFNKEAAFKKPNLFLTWIMYVIPWLLLYPLKALGGVLVFKKVRAKLGNAFRGAVSGGGALPPAVDQFFWAVGINLVEGYGLTETSPIVSVRPFRDPIFGTIGKPLNGVTVKIVGENGEELPAGQKGVVHVRGGIVMKGYYKRPDLTASVIDKDGWFNTGDIGLKTVYGEVSLRGRMKDTIVLRGGENLEPVPIEQKMLLSRFISQAVVIGQDQRNLCALIVPEAEDIKAFAKEKEISYASYAELVAKHQIKDLIEEEIKGLVNSKNGFRMFERIFDFKLLSKPFEVGIELSAKQEVMRHKLVDIYAKEIEELYK